MTNSLTPAPKKRMSKGKRLTLWIVGGIVGLFVLITAIGAIGLATQPGGFDAAVASQSAEAEAKAQEEAKAKASEDAANAATAAEKKKVDDEIAAKQAEEKAADEAAKNAHCLPVSDEMLSAIAEGNSGPAIKPLKGVAVKSTDYSKAYMIAMEFKMGDDNPETGVWVSDSLEPGGGLLMAVDAQAVVNTQWPEARKSSFKISSADHGVQESRDCLK